MLSFLLVFPTYPNGAVVNQGRFEELKTPEGDEKQDLTNDKYHLLNIWASWCLPCRKEHPILMTLKKENNLKIVGVNFKDKKLNAKVASLMNAFRVEEDMPIESGMLTRSLEGAQKKVETYYYDIRKQIFEYDEVMNNQRKAVYTERKRVLEGKELKLQVLGYGERTMEEIVEAYINEDLPPEEWDLEKLVSKVKEFIYLLEDLKPNQLFTLNVEELKNYLKYCSHFFEYFL